MLRAAAAAVAVVALAFGTAAASARPGQATRTYATPATAPLRTALLDPRFSPADLPTAFAMMRASGASAVRLFVRWNSVAPSPLPQSGWVASDPTSAGYRWNGLDTTVEDAEQAGLMPILDVIGAPGWSHAPGSKGVGYPRATDLGDFAQALATHYDGSDGLPDVNVFQVWNEPNLSLDLNPVNANVYRGLVNAVAGAVHGVDPDDLVVAGALDPFGHPKGKKQKWYSVAPLTFMRSLLCLSKGKHPHPTCHDPVHFDVWSHHPYTFGGPFGKAKIPGDVELGDLPKMHALLTAGVKLHHVVSARPVQFWVTEFGWDTNPPRKHAASLGLAARWTAESLHQMWLSGVSLVTWFLLEDYPSPSPYESGLYYHSATLTHARAKPTLTAFRFPFVAYLGKDTVSVWGRDATSDQEAVTIQLRHGKRGSWRTVAVVNTNEYGIFKAAVKLQASKKDWLRATAAGSGNSLAFSLTRPRDPNIGPWGN